MSKQSNLLVSNQLSKHTHDKYIYYKNKYLELKRTNNTNTKTNTNDIYNDNNRKYDFYIYHSMSYQLKGVSYPIDRKIISVLNSGYIDVGSNVKKSYRTHSGGEPMDYIFGNIYFPDIKNLSFLWGDGGVILHPDLIYDRGVIFNKGWQAGPFSVKNNGFIIDKNDDYKTKRRSLMKIKKWLKIRKDTNEKLNELLADLMLHEVVFDKKIPIKYIVGIICSNCPDKDVNKIKRKLKKLNMDIPIYTNNTMMDMKYYNI
jgi:hypothetical protein